MKKIYLIANTLLILCFSILSFTKPQPKPQDIPINETLKDKLDYIIDFKEKLADSSSIYSHPKSYWIYFYEDNAECFVATMANFDFYNSDEMDGYFKYRNKYITLYGLDTDCAVGLALEPELLKSKISELTDYHSDETDSLPSIIPPHEPTVFEYLIHTSDSLTLHNKYK